MLDIKKLEEIIDNKLNNYFTQLEALNSIKQLFPEIVYLPPTRGWAASPDFLLKLVELVIVDSPHYVVELGSGVSSIVLGAAINKFGHGNVISIDHDEEYSKKTKRLLEINLLTATVQVYYSPLAYYNYKGNSWLWYGEQIDELKEEIDLLVIDGPPRALQSKSRFPALPVLISKLSNKATIVLDDANRENEKEVLAMWETYFIENKIKYTLSLFQHFEKGLAIISIQK